MGIESDQLVFDYLSRVGDLAQQRQLPSATRMRLVSELRGEIDRHRAKVTVDSPAAVRRIIDRLGDPDRIVSDAQGGSAVGDPAASLSRGVPEQPSASAPASASASATASSAKAKAKPGIGRLLRKVPPQQRDEPSDAPSPPHLAGTEELGATGRETDWWRVGGGQSLAETDSVPGFTGGIEIPEILKPPAPAPASVPASVPASGGVVEPPVEKAPKVRRFVPEGGLVNPLLLLAAAALVAGAVLGNVLALLLGWAVVYLSRRLTLGQKKTAVFVLPGLAVAGGVAWLWGRSAGKWGAPIAEGQMSGAFGETWPWVLRCAAVASALYLVWRSQRVAP